jgi:hypothetical protein
LDQFLTDAYSFSLDWIWFGFLRKRSDFLGFGQNSQVCSMGIGFGFL